MNPVHLAGKGGHRLSAKRRIQVVLNRRGAITKQGIICLLAWPLFGLAYYH
jgi:hypothetical protein